ncbi:MAG TPA: ABC transporter permease, partial [Thermoanaerobaculia bacterium]
MTTTADLAPVTGTRLFPRARAKFTGTMTYIGELSQLGWSVLQMIFRGPYEKDLVIAQFESIGVRSLSIVAITSLFIGMVLALQTAYSLAEFGGKLFIGKVVSLSLVRELAPVLMSLMVGGRVGAGMTAELGTMKVTEQIDALRALATNPIRKLVFPRVFSTTVMFPLLTIISCFVGIMGGLLIATGNLHLDASFYLRSVVETVAFNDLASG